MGVPFGEIAVLVRSQTDAWADLLMPEFAARDIDAVETDWASSIFETDHIRRRLATIRLAVDPTDSLAWWALLKLERGVSRGFRDYVYEQAVRANESYGATLMLRAPEFDGAPTRQSARAASALIDRVEQEIASLDLEDPELGEFGWAEWIIDVVGREHLQDEAVELFRQAGMMVPDEHGLGYFVGHLEPLVKDLASQGNSVRLMSITSSKGITVDTCIVMGVENGIIPHPRGRAEEERRLLYVGMTRAVAMSVLTFAHRRHGRTAWHGAANVHRPRGRSSLLEALPIGRFQDGRRFADEVLREARQIE
jgi:DNA helicase-2/ATP-dependent DNA helicase PcrA